MAGDRQGDRPIVTIIGMGPLGASLGLALAATRSGGTPAPQTGDAGGGPTARAGGPIAGAGGRKSSGRLPRDPAAGASPTFEVLAHDREPTSAREAVRTGAADRAGWNLIDVVSAADLVVLAESLPEQLDTLARIAADVPEGCLVTSTAALMAPLVGAARAVTRASFVAGHPVVRHLEGADAAAFAGATWCLAPAPTASDDAVRVLADLVLAVGARPMFVDADEHDALVAGARHLPRVLSAAWASVIGASGSSFDLRRLLAAVGRGSGGGDAAELLANAARLDGWIGQAQDRLAALREALAAGDEAALAAALAAADEVSAGGAPVEPTEAQPVELERRTLGEFLFGRRRRRS